MEIKDIAGISEPLKKLIEVISQGIGTLSNPYLIKKNAEARAHEIKVISEAIKGSQNNLQQIVYEHGQVSLLSLEDRTIGLDERVQQRVEFKEQKRQMNIESVTQMAAQHLDEENEVSKVDVDKDWTSRFFNYVEDISNEEMQGLWARILAGEVKEPKSFSLRTLQVLRNLSKEEAQTFSKVAQYAIKAGNDAFLLQGNNSEILDKYDIGFNEMALLKELDLLHSGDLVNHSLIRYEQDCSVAYLFGEKVVVVYKKANSPQKDIPIILFTTVGKQLLKLIKSKPNFSYLQHFAEEVNDNGISTKYGEVLEVCGSEIKHTNPLIEIPSL
ncbi:DUF2806 domain-containing protein [Fulvivirga ulvae]|uniref:DUF2806 domain-containing protein n=1 Tax=Fulvivirga ulvae TaxID=2904245 RepID=UPI001F2F2B4B|nr:DUF2806 domain-containing protein [Fulvivirga ulvae]UII30058.1 DUF2806 domain-containing protein [Fulvivirga ulvae]